MISLLNRIHAAVQYILLLLQFPFQPPLNFVFRLFGVERYFVVRSVGGSYIDKGASEDLFHRLVLALEDAKEVHISLGEMGHRLADEPEILDALERANIRHNAAIQVVHGPRVDPETYQMFFLAWARRVRIYMTPSYNRRHFILIRSVDDKVSVLDEGIHNEALWTSDSKGKPVKIYSSKYRIYYFRDRSVRLATHLEAVFQSRLKSAQEITSNVGQRPPYEHPYKRPIVRTILVGFRNSPARWLKQPIENLFDVVLRNNLSSVDNAPMPKLVGMESVCEVKTGLYFLNPQATAKVNENGTEELKKKLVSLATTELEKATLRRANLTS